eukprot:9929231-Lingulodinium_polyedra.AAC.1
MECLHEANSRASAGLAQGHANYSSTCTAPAAGACVGSEGLAARAPSGALQPALCFAEIQGPTVVGGAGE